MAASPDSPVWCSQLPWLTEFGFDANGTTAAAGISPLLATATRRLPARRTLAQQLGRGEALGVDMVHGAVNELLAQHALPQFATLAIAGDAAGGFAESVVAGVLRACRGHGVPVAAPLAVQAPCEQVGLTLAGAVLGALAPTPVAGDVVLGMRSTGPTDGDFERLSQIAASRGEAIASQSATGGVGPLLVTPRASHASVMHEALRQGWPFVAVAIDGSLAANVRRALPGHLDVAWDFGAWRPCAPFDGWREATASECSVGCTMVVIVAEREASRWLEWTSAWNEPAVRLGRVTARA